MSFKPIDGKRDEFRKYLERTGVLEAITKVLIKLLNAPERPENAVEFIRNNLGVTLSQANTIKQLTADLEDAQNEIAQLKRTVEQLQANKVKDALKEVVAPEQTVLPPVQDTAPPATKEPEEPPAVIEKTNTETPALIETVQLAEPDSTEQESKPAATEVSSPAQEGGGN